MVECCDDPSHSVGRALHMCVGCMSLRVSIWLEHRQACASSIADDDDASKAMQQRGSEPSGGTWHCLERRIEGFQGCRFPLWRLRCLNPAVYEVCWVDSFSPLCVAVKEDRPTSITNDTLVNIAMRWFVFRKSPEVYFAESLLKWGATIKYLGWWKT